MVVDLPISESSAYKAGPTIDKGYKEKETNKDKRSVKLENVGDIPDYKNTGKRKIDQEENNNKGETSFAISSAIPVLENKDKFAVSDKSKISKVKTDKLLLIKETSICISSSLQNTTISQQKEKIDLTKDFKEEKTLPEAIHKSNDQNKDNLNDSMKDQSQSNNHEKTNEQSSESNENKDNGSVAPGKNCNAPLFIPSNYLSSSRPPPINTVYEMKEPCIYYPAYPSYYDSSNHPISYGYNKTNSIDGENLNDDFSEKPVKKSQLQKEKDISIENVSKENESNEPSKHCTNGKEDKSSSVERLSVIEEPNNNPPENTYTKITPLKEETSKMGDVSVESFTPLQYESHNSENNGNPEAQSSYSLQNTDEPSPFIASHPMLSPITGNHGDLFINPALAAQAHGALQAHGLMHPDPPSFMSFLPDGGLVSPMGDMYCPPPDYYMMDQNGDMPPGLVPPPHSNSFDGNYKVSLRYHKRV